MTRPIANARHVAPRPRRTRSPRLFRMALSLCLALASALALLAACDALLPQSRATAPIATHIASAGVADGACMSFAPSGRARDKSIYLDPGHGGLDTGAVGSVGGATVLEKDLTLAVGLRLEAMLTGDGYRVIMSRVRDESVAKLSAADAVSGALTADGVHRDLLARASCADAAKASVLLSIHFNAFDDPSVGGTETFYDAERSFAADNRALASDVQAALVAGLGSTDRGVWTDDSIVGPALTPQGSDYGHLIELGPPDAGWVDRPSEMPGALVEPLFLTNAAEARYAASPSGQERIAGALRAGVETYLANA